MAADKEAAGLSRVQMYETNVYGEKHRGIQLLMIRPGYNMFTENVILLHDYV